MQKVITYNDKWNRKIIDRYIVGDSAGDEFKVGDIVLWEHDDYNYSKGRISWIAKKDNIPFVMGLMGEPLESFKKIQVIVKAEHVTKEIFDSLFEHFRFNEWETKKLTLEEIEILLDCRIELVQ